MLTGGEPLYHRRTVEIIRRLKDIGIKVKLDTNGYYPARLKEVIKDVDYIAMDIKGPWENYPAGVKIDISRVVESVELIMSKAKDYEFRTTVINTDPDWMLAVAEQVAGAKRYFLQHLRVDNRPVYPIEILYKFKEEIKYMFDYVGVR